MNITYPPAIAALPLLQATQRVWALRHLWHAGHLDPIAADLALRSLREHPHPRVAALAAETTHEIVKEFRP